MTIEEQRDIYREETHRWKAALQALEKENAELRQQLAAFHAAMEREKKPDWEKWLKDLADSLETEWDPGKSSCAEAARQLRYMADSFTLKANFVPSELKIKELEQQLETANLCIRGLEGNLAAAEKEHERLEAEAAVMRLALGLCKRGTNLSLIEKALSATAGTDLIAKIERYEKALKQIGSSLNPHGSPFKALEYWQEIAREALGEQ